MAMEITNNYSSYVAQSTVNPAKKKETKAGETQSVSEYMKGLENLAPSVEFRVGTTFAADKTGKTLTINPKLLEKMQNDPEKEKEMKELIKGVETATRLVDSFFKGTGRKVVFRHSYIDENGEFRSFAYIKKDDKLNEKLRKERWENSEKLIEKTRKKAAEKKKELQEILVEKRTEKQESKAVILTKEKETKMDQAQRLVKEKAASSEDGRIYLNDAEFRMLIEAAEEQETRANHRKAQQAVGGNLDLQA